MKTTLMIVGAVLLGGGALAGAWLYGQSQSDVGYEDRRAYLNEMREIFAHDVWLEGPDDVGIVMDDKECTYDRLKRYAVERRVRDAGFRWLRCSSGERVDL